MSRVASFEFYEDPVAFTNPGVCSINWTAQTISFTGVSTIAFAQCDEFVQVVTELCTQSVADNIVESSKKILGGASPLLVSYNEASVPPTLTVGAANMPATKAMDLASGIQMYVLDELV